MDPILECKGNFFRVLVPAVDKDGRQPRDIQFMPLAGSNIPAAYFALQQSLEQTLTTFDLLFPRDEARSKSEAQFASYFSKLAGIAIVGLGQDQVELARLALITLQQETVAREAGRIKNKYIGKLGRWGLVFGTTTAVAYCAARYGYFWDWIAAKKEFFLLFSGGFVGTWLSFSIRNVRVSFEDLLAAETDRLSPLIRQLVVAGLTLFVGLIFSTKMATLTFGEFNTHFISSGTYALLIGLFCGLGEQSLSLAVDRRVSEFMSALGGAPPPPPAPPAGDGKRLEDHAGDRREDDPAARGEAERKEGEEAARRKAAGGGEGPSEPNRSGRSGPGRQGVEPATTDEQKQGGASGIAGAPSG